MHSNNPLIFMNGIKWCKSNTFYMICIATLIQTFAHLLNPYRHHNLPVVIIRNNTWDILSMILWMSLKRCRCKGCVSTWISIKWCKSNTFYMICIATLIQTFAHLLNPYRHHNLPVVIIRNNTWDILSMILWMSLKRCGCKGCVSTHEFPESNFWWWTIIYRIIFVHIHSFIQMW